MDRSPWIFMKWFKKQIINVSPSSEALASLKLRGPGGKLLLLSGNDSKTNETALPSLNCRKTPRSVPQTDGVNGTTFSVGLSGGGTAMTPCGATRELIGPSCEISASKYFNFNVSPNSSHASVR
ncbi:hypothetical protein EYF80_048017 [Liparis tanakae]|uniref:Uncharacterized protein n=1 Tax=Liparis tanakae TaxID=230148 RepID=A0A4Z2FKN6_9TELE|nr:hypothetical protein EYF80_048017 [Liparis tanakae]